MYTHIQEKTYVMRAFYHNRNRLSREKVFRLQSYQIAQLLGKLAVLFVPPGRPHVTDWTVAKQGILPVLMPANP
jgi:hypothetical protein